VTPKGKADAHSHRHRARTTIAKDKLGELREKADEAARYLDMLQRKTAEFDNFRKRTVREREDLRRSAAESLLAELLPVIDNFELAIEAAERSREFESLLEGVVLTERQMVETLGRFGLSRMDPLGEPFDPNLHEAFAREETDEYPENTVIDVIRNGYTLGGKVLRPALVRVSVEPDRLS